MHWGRRVALLAIGRWLNCHHLSRRHWAVLERWQRIFLIYLHMGGKPLMMLLKCASMVDRIILENAGATLTFYSRLLSTERRVSILPHTSQLLDIYICCKHSRPCSFINLFLLTRNTGFLFHPFENKNLAQQSKTPRRDRMHTTIPSIDSKLITQGRLVMYCGEERDPKPQPGDPGTSLSYAC